MRVVSSWVEVVVVGAWLVRAAVPCRRVEAGRWLEVEVGGRLWRSAAVLDDVVGVLLRSMYAAAAKDQSNLYNTVVVEVEAEWHVDDEVEAVGRLDGDNDDAVAVAAHVATAK